MKQFIIAVATLVLAVPVMADTFGTGANQFTIDFVTISGATNPSSGYGIVNNDYRIGKFEITNDQWDKFEAESGRSFMGSIWLGDDIPVNNKNWNLAATFINWLNTSNKYQEAYNIDEFGVFDVWDTSVAAGGTNLYRHKDAFYFLPNEDEWVKAAYWNGSSLQTHATKAGESITQGNGTSGVGWNYYNNGYATNPFGPWDVGGSSQEINSTYDMMGNMWEWMESPYNTGDYLLDSFRSIRGGSYISYDIILSSSNRAYVTPYSGDNNIGFRVASIPEPCTLMLLGLGGMILRKKHL